MRAFRRLTLLASIFVTGAFALSVPAAASSSIVSQSPAGLLSAGKYAFSTTRASFNVFPADPSQTTINLSVTRERSKSTLLHSPTTKSDVTTLSITVSTDSYFGTPTGGACALLDTPADFRVSSDLHSATLHTTIVDTTPTCGDVTLPLPLTLDVTWTGSGPVQTTRGTNRFSCVRYTKETKSTDSSNSASATFSMSGLSGSVTADHQTIGINDQLVRAQGALPPDTCLGSVGRGAGRPNPPAGTYHATLLEANTFYTSDDGLTQVFLTVDRIGNTSHPRGGRSTSSSETQLSFFVTSPTVNASGCFVLTNPGDFTISSALSVATLHVALDGDTPGCNGQGNDISPVPFIIDASWVGTAPIATTRDDSQFTCLNYHVHNVSVQRVNTVAVTTISVPGIDGVLTASGGLGSSDIRTSADGVADPGCAFRG